MASNLRMGNVFNQLTGVTPESEQRQARSLALANTFAGVADTLAGKDFQPGMSGFEQALIAGSRGAAQGFKNKAEMEKAKQQDELNAWAQQLADNEAQQAAALEYEQKVQDSMNQAALPVASAVIAFKDGQIDEPTYKASITNILRSMLRARGEELISAEPENGDPYTFGIQARDEETGKITTSVKSVSELVPSALRQNAEIGQAFAASIGNLPKDYFSKEKAGDEKLTFEQFRQMSPEERALYKEFSGKGGKTDKSKGVSSARERILGTAGSKETQKQDAEILNGFDQRAVSANALKRLQQGLAEGVRTGGLTEITAESIGILNTLLGTNIKMPADIAEFRSLLKDQLGSALQIYGAGTGISNRDVISAEQTIGTVDTPKEALQKILAGMSARLEASDEYANELEQIMLQEDAGRITPAESDARRARLRNNFRSRIDELYNQKLDESLAMEQNFMRTGSTSGQVTPQEIEIDLDGNIVQ